VYLLRATLVRRCLTTGLKTGRVSVALLASLTQPFTRPQSFDHLIGACEEGWRGREAERGCGFEVQDELEFRRLLDGQV
jgi:hypothetical protein